MKRARRDAGFTLAGLICVMTAVAITSAVMVPLRVMQSKREQEKELIFRGEEYVRAIRKYQRKYQAYPAAVEDLITRDGYRFLRKPYKDPISGEDFRLINVNPDGTLTGSVTMLSLPVSTQNAGGGAMTPGSLAGAAPGALPSTGGQNSGGNSQTGQANMNNIGGISGLGGSMGSGSNSGISGVSSPFASGGGQNNASGRPQGVGTGVGSGMGSGVGAGGGALGIGGSPVGIGSTAGNGQQQNNGNANRPGGGGVGGAGGPGAGSALPTNTFTGGGATAQISPGLAGVGSQSTGTAVMIYNTKEKYNEWEFITPLEQTAGGPNGRNGQNGQNGERPSPTGPNANPFQGGTPPFGQTGNPLSGGSSPFGGAGNPVGGGFGGGTPSGGGANQSRPSGPVGVGPGGRP